MDIQTIWVSLFVFAVLAALFTRIIRLHTLDIEVDATRHTTKFSNCGFRRCFFARRRVKKEVQRANFFASSFLRGGGPKAKKQEAVGPPKNEASRASVVVKTAVASESVVKLTAVERQAVKKTSLAKLTKQASAASARQRCAENVKKNKRLAQIKKAAQQIASRSRSSNDAEDSSSSSSDDDDPSPSPIPPERSSKRRKRNASTATMFDDEYGDDFTAEDYAAMLKLAEEQHLPDANSIADAFIASDQATCRRVLCRGCRDFTCIRDAADVDSLPRQEELEEWIKNHGLFLWSRIKDAKEFPDTAPEVKCPCCGGDGSKFYFLEKQQVFVCDNDVPDAIAVKRRATALRKAEKINAFAGITEGAATVLKKVQAMAHSAQSSDDDDEDRENESESEVDSNSTGDNSSKNHRAQRCGYRVSQFHPFISKAQTSSTGANKAVTLEAFWLFLVMLCTGSSIKSATAMCGLKRRQGSNIADNIFAAVFAYEQRPIPKGKYRKIIIDETNFGKRKYNVGSLSRYFSYWFVTIVEESYHTGRTGRVHFIPVVNRGAETLEAIVNNFSSGGKNPSSSLTAGKATAASTSSLTT